MSETPPETVVTKSQTESVTVSQVVLPGEGLVKELIRGSSPIARGTALALFVFIVAITGLLYFNKEYFTDIRDYRITIARLESKVESNAERFEAQSGIMDLLKDKIIAQQIEIRDQQIQISNLTAEVARLRREQTAVNK